MTKRYAVKMSLGVYPNTKLISAIIIAIQANYCVFNGAYITKNNLTIKDGYNG